MNHPAKEPKVLDRHGNLAPVIPRPGARLEPPGLLAWCNERLGRHQRLSEIEVRADFPRNALGKVLKRLLREPYRRNAQADGPEGG